jgi:hypothetical protein
MRALHLHACRLALLVSKLSHACSCRLPPPTHTLKSIIALNTVGQSKWRLEMGIRLHACRLALLVSKLSHAAAGRPPTHTLKSLH